MLKVIYIVLALLVSTNLFAQFGTTIEVNSNWSSTTIGDKDAITDTVTTVDLVELYYSKELGVLL